MVNSKMVYSEDILGFSLENFPLYAFIFAYNESDIIESTIKNAFIQGCDKVFVVDHCSDDNTVEKAIDAGAILYDRYNSKYFEEDQKVLIANRCMDEVSSKVNEKHIWWLFIDADELPHGPFGKTIKEYIRSISTEYRVIGSTFLNHYPGNSIYKPGSNPAFAYPKAEMETLSYCNYNHMKHQLIRYDQDQSRIIIGPGYHIFACDSCPLVEPIHGIFTHHFPYRSINTTSNRLRKIILEDKLFKMKKKLKTTEKELAKNKSYNDVFRSNPDQHHWELRWQNIRQAYRKHKELYHWKELVPHEHAFFSGWE
ncbi:glycosyltransferase family 2 protein [Desulfonatronovibrio magnus]|uniref:glycosyltransferase family 2 protein n=1 Tax=Desulfonatronovibrio magnus TaxID=698827 RepID=UPI0005EBB6F0|nr:glycosyltransferase family 2 protein [Desulfonatronovibrio magnus]